MVSTTSSEIFAAVPFKPKMNEVVVVGAGIFGLSSALALADKGYKVSVIDADDIPAESASSTDVNKIIRGDYGADDYWTDFALQCVDEWEKFNKKAGEDVFVKCGIILLTRSEMKEGEFEYESFKRMKLRNVPVHRLTVQDLKERYPLFANTGFVDGYFNPKGGYARARRALEFMKLWAEEKGVKMYPFHKCTKILYNIETDGKKTAIGVETNKGEMRADIVVVAAGAWTGGIISEVDQFVSVRGMPVYLLSANAESKEKLSPWVANEMRSLPVWTADITRTGWYGFPLIHDHHTNTEVFKLGNHGEGYSYGSVDIQNYPVSKPKLPAHAESILSPFLDANMPLLNPSKGHTKLSATRMCLYDDSWDSNPYVCKLPNCANVIIANGSSGHGFKFGPLWGKIVADVIENGVTEKDLKVLGWRDHPNKESVDKIVKKDACRPSQPVLESKLDSKL